MTQAEYAALPAFFRGASKATIEAQYARNAQGLRTMESKALRTGRKVGGFTASQLTERAERFETLSRRS